MCKLDKELWCYFRILAVGWNRHVTEFSDTIGIDMENPKLWDVCHTEDVLASAVRESQTLATSSYNGELVLWKLETGQPYRRYKVDNPNARVKVYIYLLSFLK